VKRSVLVLLASLLLGSVSFAQQNPADAPASKEDVQRYLEAMHVQDMMKSTMDVMTKQMHKTIHQMVEKQQGLPADFEARVDKTIDDMLKDFPVDQYLEAVAPVYEKHLTKGDVDALVTFYTSPTGQKVLKEMPAMMADAMQAASPIIQKMMAKAMERVQTEIAQARKADDGTSKKNSQPVSN
jgi:uncharacterized protein